MAAAWKSSFDRSAAAAADLMPSGAMMWGLDESEEVFSAFGIGSQPWTVLIAEGVEVKRWPGARGYDEIKSEVDAMLALVG